MLPCTPCYHVPPYLRTQAGVYVVSAEMLMRIAHGPIKMRNIRGFNGGLLIKASPRGAFLFRASAIQSFLVYGFPLRGSWHLGTQLEIR